MKTKFELVKRAARLVLLSTFTTFYVAQLSTCFAQGTAFTYQGRLSDGVSPASGIYNLTFTLFNTNTSGVAVAGPVTNTAVNVTNGLFTVLIDFGSGVFTGATNWLQIGVETNVASSFTTLTPRQQLTPTPYAIYAENANAAGISGTVPNASLSGTYGNAVILNNAGNSFSGNGGGLTNVNAATLGGLGASQFWKTTGNSNTVAGVNFLGTVDHQPLELWVNQARALRLEPGTNVFSAIGAPNVIGGAPDNFVDGGIIGATIAGGGAVNMTGFMAGPSSNHVSAIFGTIGGGRLNTLGADHGFIGGGIANTVQPFAYDAVIGGGVANIIQTNASESVLVGGTYNSIQQGSSYSFLGGGNGNSIQGPAAFTVLAGGRGNSIAGTHNGIGFSTISGGDQNSIQTNGAYSTIGGGDQNTVQTNGTYNVIGGGVGNTIRSSRAYATIAGGAYNIADGNGTTVGGGYGNASIGSSNYYYATVAGGNGNTANGYTATVGGGGGNSAILDDATVAGGGYNTSSNFAATVGGGFGNKSTGNNYATIAGGGFNLASGDTSTVGGGEQNTSSSQFATVGGGFINGSRGWSSTVPGGYANNANGDYSFAAGSVALAAHSGAFVWSDASDFSGFSSTSPNQFAVRALGGVRFVTGGAGMTLDGQAIVTTSALSNVALLAGGNAFTGQQTITGGDANQLVLQNSADSRSWYIYDEHFNGSGALIFQPSGGPGNVGAYIRRSDGNYVVNSDLRLKRDITAIGGVLDRVLQLRPVSYHFRSAPEGTPLTLGLIAQEVEPLFPEVVGEHNGIKSMAYSELIPVTIRAVQELNQKLEEQRAELTQKETEVTELKQRLAALEEVVLNQKSN